MNSKTFDQKMWDVIAASEHGDVAALESADRAIFENTYFEKTFRYMVVRVAIVHQQWKAVRCVRTRFGPSIESMLFHTLMQEGPQTIPATMGEFFFAYLSENYWPRRLGKEAWDACDWNVVCIANIASHSRVIRSDLRSVLRVFLEMSPECPMAGGVCPWHQLANVFGKTRWGNAASRRRAVQKAAPLLGKIEPLVVVACNDYLLGLCEENFPEGWRVEELATDEHG